jgi:hypothetical protein
MCHSARTPQTYLPCQLRVSMDRVNSGSRALVVMVKSANLGDLDHATAPLRMNCPAFRTIHLQGLMNSPTMVVASR